MDSNLMLLLIVVVVIGAIAFQLKSARTFPYVKAGPLLSAAERSFFSTLAKAIEPGDLVMVKVRVADLIKIKEGVSKEGQSSHWWKAFAQISQKHVDFAVVDRLSFQPKLVVELDDSSHASAKAQESDSVKDRAFAAAGLPVARFKAQRTYDVNEVAAGLIRAMTPPAQPSKGLGVRKSAA